MLCKGCLLLILAFASFTYAVKVNLQGSLSLGKEVMDTISHYLLRGYGISGRRSMNGDLDSIPMEVKSSKLCKNLEFCEGKLEGFFNEYVTSLATAIDAVFDGILKEKTEPNQELTSVFVKLKGSLHDVRKILKSTNEKVTDDKEMPKLLETIKKISSVFQRKAVTNIIDRVQTNQHLKEIKKKLIQTLVVSISATEARAEKKLCFEYGKCSKSIECSKALNTVLYTLIKLPDDQVKKFMQALFEALPETTIYSVLSEVTANEFQVILNDMAYFANVPTKDILTSIQQIVQSRINNIDSETNSTDEKNGQDVQLVNIILADMDYIYSRHKHDPFHVFLEHFEEWTKTGGKISSQVKRIVKNIVENLKTTSDDIVLKLIDEVRVFLEITVDP